MQDFFHHQYYLLDLLQIPKAWANATTSQHSHVPFHSLVAFAMPSASRKSRPKSLPLMTTQSESHKQVIPIRYGSARAVLNLATQHDSNGILLSQYHNFMWAATHLGLVHPAPEIHPTLCQHPFPPKKIQHPPQSPGFHDPLCRYAEVGSAEIPRHRFWHPAMQHG